MKMTIRIAAVALAGTLAIAGAITLCGCDAVTDSVSKITGQATGGAIGSSKTTDEADRQNYGVVEDIDGNKYVTVMYMVEPGNTTFSDKDIKQILTDANINWYQLITANAMGTDKQEYGMLYFPATATYSDMQKVRDALAKRYDCHIMTVPEYDKYIAESPTDQLWDIKIYGAETTYFGPAAQPKE